MQTRLHRCRQQGRSRRVTLTVPCPGGVGVERRVQGGGGPLVPGRPRSRSGGQSGAPRRRAAIRDGRSSPSTARRRYGRCRGTTGASPTTRRRPGSEFLPRLHRDGRGSSAKCGRRSRRRCRRQSSAPVPRRRRSDGKAVRRRDVARWSVISTSGASLQDLLNLRRRQAFLPGEATLSVRARSTSSAAQSPVHHPPVAHCGATCPSSSLVAILFSPRLPVAGPRVAAGHTRSLTVPPREPTNTRQAGVGGHGGASPCCGQAAAAVAGHGRGLSLISGGLASDAQDFSE